MADANALREPGLPIPVVPESGPPAPGGESIMSLVDHLGELRTRLFRIILGVVAGAAVGFYFSTTIRNGLLNLLPDGNAQTLGPGDGFAITLRIALITGVILAMPVILYQLWAFIAPGLTPAERKGIRPWVPLALFFFALGVGIAYLVLPFALSF
ncbi:MAG: twin-arginine translocase subunit TatC, partial [Candidatus Limnocylindrales bacterium]